MGLTGVAAVVYAVLCGGIVVFQIALILGAPWGVYTQGGGIAGPLPTPRRAAAGLSGVLNMAMAAGILSAAGLAPGWPAWTGWAALAVTLLSCVLNGITRSRPERRLWFPVTGAMLALALIVMLA